jgi:putative ABC transport system permease protein
MTIGSINSGIRLALSTVVEHKMRSFLTVLGVIIGTGAVIGVGSIIAGLDGARRPLTLENARAIAERCPSVEHVSPYLMAGGGFRRARYKGNDYYGIQMGGTEEGYAYGGTTMKYGRFFSETENSHHMPVVVIGEDIQKRLLPTEDPVNKSK